MLSGDENKFVPSLLVIKSFALKLVGIVHIFSELMK